MQVMYITFDANVNDTIQIKFNVEYPMSFCE